MVNSCGEKDNYSANTTKTQINVEGWKLHYSNSASNGWFVKVWYNMDETVVVINDPANVQFNTSESIYVSNCLNDAKVRPSRPVFITTWNETWIIREGSADIKKVASNGTNHSGTVYIQFSWVNQMRKPLYS